MSGAAQAISCAAAAAKTILRNLTGKNFDPETAVLDRFIRPGSVCFDIGAAYGRYALVMSRLAGARGRVYCFEPADYSYSVLRAVDWFHRLKNVTLVKQALSDETGFAELAIPVKRSSSFYRGLGHSLAHLTASADSTCERKLVSVTTLNRFVTETGIERIDFIKCDVEGAELSVFEGGREALERFRPSILCEVYEAWLARYGRTRHDVEQFFSESGYRIFKLKERNLEEMDTIHEDGNYFLIPSGSKIKV